MIVPYKVENYPDEIWINFENEGIILEKDDFDDTYFNEKSHLYLERDIVLKKLK